MSEALKIYLVLFVGIGLVYLPTFILAVIYMIIAKGVTMFYWIIKKVGVVK